MLPRSIDKPHASPADRASCRAALCSGSRSFFAASLALPKSVREPATGLYAFCRMADDAIDLGKDKLQALRELHVRLDRIYAGEPQDHAADRAFADVVARFAIPKAFPLGLLEGFEWDAHNRRYDDLSQLTAYSVRVAGTVGAMMGMVMDVRCPSLISRACDLGVAMQLTNIARDVGEDARGGRLYLPLEWLREVNIDPEKWLARPVFNQDLSIVIARLLAAAEVLYERSDSGIASLPVSCRPGMHAARLFYSEIGREISRRKFDSVNQRAVVSWRRKAKMLADAVVLGKLAAAAPDGAILDEARFLLDAMPDRRVDRGSNAVGTPARENRGWRGVRRRIVWMIDLFERLEQRDRALRQAVNAS
jgi:phytoene synthase